MPHIPQNYPIWRNKSSRNSKCSLRLSLSKLGIIELVSDVIRGMHPKEHPLVTMSWVPYQILKAGATSALSVMPEGGTPILLLSLSLYSRAILTVCSTCTSNLEVTSLVKVDPSLHIYYRPPRPKGGGQNQKNNIKNSLKQLK